MKHALLAVLLLAGCYWQPEPDWEEYFDSIPPLGLTSVYEVVRWTATNVTYKKDSGEYWQSPEQTFSKRTGDCEDFTILALYLIKQETGIEGRMAVGYSATSGHAWVAIGDDWWEPIYGYLVPKSYYQGFYPSIFYIDYDDALRRSQTTHREVTP